ncbi:hypothetical protein [Streptomyces sp. NPDC059781]
MCRQAAVMAWLYTEAVHKAPDIAERAHLTGQATQLNTRRRR